MAKKPQKFSVSHLPTSLCPKCGSALDAATSTEGNGQPSPGNVSLCFDCMTVLVFDDSLHLRLISDDELRSMKETKPENFARLMRAKRALVMGKIIAKAEGKRLGLPNDQKLPRTRH